MRVGCNFLPKCDAADVGKQDVEDDQVRRLMIDPPQSVDPVRSFLDIEAGQRERRAIHPAKISIILDDQYLMRAGRHDEAMIPEFGTEQTHPSVTRYSRACNFCLEGVSARSSINDLMSKPKVLLIVDRQDLRVRYEMILRFSGYEPIALASSELDEIPADVVAACILTVRRPGDAAVCSRLLANAVPVVRIDPFIRHAREHLPFDVVLPLASEPRQLITALHHLLH